MVSMSQINAFVLFMVNIAAGSRSRASQLRKADPEGGSRNWKAPMVNSREGSDFSL
jgi:hypothetical protein